MALPNVVAGDPHASAHNAERAVINALGLLLQSVSVSVKDPAYGATGDGSTDDTIAIHAARTAAGAGGILFFPPGTYKTTGLTANFANQIWQFSPGAKLLAATSQTLITVSAANVSVLGPGTLDGNNVGTTAGSAFFAGTAAPGVTISKMTLINCAGIGINCAGADNVTIADNTVTNSGAAGVSFTTSGADLKGARIEKNTIAIVAVGPYGIQMYGQGGNLINRPRVKGNSVTLPAGSTSGICIEVRTGIRGGVIRGNVTSGGSMGMSLDSNQASSIVGNHAFGATLNGFELAGCGFCVVSGCTVDGNLVTATAFSNTNTGPGWNNIVGCSFRNLSTTGRGIYGQDTSGIGLNISGCTGTAKSPVILAGQKSQSVCGNTWLGENSAVAAVELNNVTGAEVANNVCNGFSGAAVNAYTGTMNDLIIGPNIVDGAAVDLLNGWTPGTNGLRSKLIRGNTAAQGVVAVTPGASPWTYTNVHTYAKTIYIRGGTVSSINRGAFQLATASPFTGVLQPGDTLTVTYSVAPTVNTDGL